VIKLMKYLKKSAGYVVLIIALLFLQAYCDLSLPDYTSKIVNVGIQQSGIEDSVPEKIRKTSMDNLKLFMDEEDKKTVDSFYEEAGDNLVLKDDVKSDERDVLNDILAKPMMIAASFSSGSDEVNEMLAKMGVPEGTDPMQAISQLPEEALTSMIEKISEKIDKMQPSILTHGRRCRCNPDALHQDLRSQDAGNGTYHHALCNLRGISFIQSGSSTWS